MHTANLNHHPAYAQHLQDRLASALHRLAALEAGGSGTELHRNGERSTADALRRVNEDLERAIVEVQEISASYERLRSSAEYASQRADLLFQLSPIPCVVLDRSGVIVEANPAAARAVNLSQVHLEGRLFQLFVGSDRAAFVTRLGSLERGERAAQWPVTIRARERSSLKMTFAAAVDPEDRILAMLLPAGGQEADVSGAVEMSEIETV
jgi:PAS domain-containing protein